MSKYRIEITDTVEWVYEVEAASEQEAMEKVDSGNVQPISRNPSSSTKSPERIADPTVEEIEAYMDKAYAEYVEAHPEALIENLTVLISKEDFELLQAVSRTKLRGNFPDPSKVKLTGYHTKSAPWGFQLSHSNKLKSPEAFVLDAG